MDQQQFDRLVSEDVKNVLPQEKQDYLRLPEHLNNWKKTLLKLLDNLDEQILEISQNEKVIAENLPTDMISSHRMEADEKKTKIGRFRFYVTQKLSEAERLIVLGESGQEEELRLASFYRNVILEHRSIMEKYQFEPTPIDHALWNSIDGVWGFVDLEKQINEWPE
jgi:hypothetical protein